MSGEAIGAVSIAVVLLTQLVKFMNLIPDRWGPAAVLLWSLLGVLLYGWSNDESFGTRLAAWQYFVGWLTTAAGAAGIYGFTRASSVVVTQMSAPPGGAGQQPTTNEPPPESRHDDSDSQMG